MLGRRPGHAVGKVEEHEVPAVPRPAERQGECAGTGPDIEDQIAQRPGRRQARGQMSNHALLHRRITIVVASMRREVRAQV